ncbi:His-Xaa-Ser repeat protein HxsA2 [Nocardia inohanensis]|uniref:His-Xaa-Ser repeat protein HxsA2 n=1 Tax=Nocardia inohanensis TaxID=209246 RepID=UPI000A06C595|nr:His-Xaa-Ser repeat protein HxsA2 [Nocardia inohanensis]
MRETPKIVSLTAALAALAIPTAAQTVAETSVSTGTDEPHVTAAREEARPEPRVAVPDDLELMSFTTHRADDGTLFARHGSHSSHSSHSSHASHASSSPGFGGPNVPKPSYIPTPAVTPPAAPPTTTTPPTSSQPAADPFSYACTRAKEGLGLNEIARELQDIFGLTATEAEDLAQRALDLCTEAGTTAVPPQ